MCATSGSAITTALSLSWRSFIAGYEMSCGASAEPTSWPVSCCGNSPAGTLVNSQIVVAIVPIVTTPISDWWRSTKRSARP
jgi:hypothetical protein